MKIFINGKEHDCDQDAALEDVISIWRKENPYFAVAVNTSFIPKNKYEEVSLREGDQVEIVAPKPGG